MTPNEARATINLPPVAGGDTVYRQQQDFSLMALSKRDAKEDPFATSSSASTKIDQTTTDTAANDNAATARAATAVSIRRGLDALRRQRKGMR